MGNFWKHIGMGFAAIGRGAAKTAIWASQHPEVLAAVGGIAQAAGAPPIVTQSIGAAVAIDQSLKG